MRLLCDWCWKFCRRDLLVHNSEELLLALQSNNLARKFSSETRRDAKWNNQGCLVPLFHATLLRFLEAPVIRQMFWKKGRRVSSWKQKIRQNLNFGSLQHTLTGRKLANQIAGSFGYFPCQHWASVCSIHQHYFSDLSATHLFNWKSLLFGHSVRYFRINFICSIFFDSFGSSFLHF